MAKTFKFFLFLFSFFAMVAPIPALGQDRYLYPISGDYPEGYHTIKAQDKVPYFDLQCAIWRFENGIKEPPQMYYSEESYQAMKNAGSEGGLTLWTVAWSEVSNLFFSKYVSRCYTFPKYANLYAEAKLSREYGGVELPAYLVDYLRTPSALGFVGNVFMPKNIPIALRSDKEFIQSIAYRIKWVLDNDKITDGNYHQDLDLYNFFTQFNRERFISIAQKYSDKDKYPVIIEGEPLINNSVSADKLGKVYDIWMSEFNRLGVDTTISGGTTWEKYAPRCSQWLFTNNKYVAGQVKGDFGTKNQNCLLDWISRVDKIDAHRTMQMLIDNPGFSTDIESYSWDGRRENFKKIYSYKSWAKYPDLPYVDFPVVQNILNNSPKNEDYSAIMAIVSPLVVDGDGSVALKNVQGMQSVIDLYASHKNYNRVQACRNLKSAYLQCDGNGQVSLKSDFDNYSKQNFVNNYKNGYCLVFVPEENLKSFCGNITKYVDLLISKAEFQVKRLEPNIINDLPLPVPPAINHIHITVPPVTLPPEFTETNQQIISKLDNIANLISSFKSQSASLNSEALNQLLAAIKELKTANPSRGGIDDEDMVSILSKMDKVIEAINSSGTVAAIDYSEVIQSFKEELVSSVQSIIDSQLAETEQSKIQHAELLQKLNEIGKIGVGDNVNTEKIEIVNNHINEIMSKNKGFELNLFLQENNRSGWADVFALPKKFWEVEKTSNSYYTINADTITIDTKNDYLGTVKMKMPYRELLRSFIGVFSAIGFTMWLFRRLSDVI